MNKNDCRLERVSNVTIGFILMILGLLFALSGITVLPVIGFFIAVPVLILAGIFLVSPRSKACVEFSVRGNLPDPQAFRRALLEVASELDVDLALQQDNMYRRNRRLVAFDMDSTLIEAEVIDELAAEAGVGEQVKAITERAMRGELDGKGPPLVRDRHRLPVVVLQEADPVLEVLQGDLGTLAEPHRPVAVERAARVDTHGQRIDLAVLAPAAADRPPGNTERLLPH